MFEVLVNGHYIYHTIKQWPAICIHHPAPKPKPGWCLSNTKEIHTSASQEHRDLQAFGSYDWQLRAQAFESSLPKSGVKSLI